MKAGPLTVGTGRTAVTVYDERDKVLAWRLHCLWKAGFTADQAKQLAHDEQGWRNACRAVELGCDHDTALRIGVGS